MKKSFFGFSAKVAMAVLAVCSFVFTSCYEKTPIAKTPTEYHVIGSVYDAETGKVITDAKVTLDGKSVSSTFNVKLSGYVSSVTVSATAEGYMPGSRTVSIQKMDEYNQVSVTSVDLALVKVDVEEPSLELKEVVDGKALNLDAAAVKDLFAINFGEVEVNEGKVEVFAHYSFDSDLHANLHMNFEGEHANGVTNEPYFVEDSLYIGFIADMSEVVAGYEDDAKVACITELNTVYAGAAYADFAKSYVPFATLLNRNGELSMGGYCVCKDFNLVGFVFTFDGEEMNVVALQSASTHISPIVADTHDNHDNHDNHNNHHNNHGHGGATAWGGGSSVEGE